MTLKGAIFDLDGVIVNTVPLHFKAWQRLFKEFGYAFTMEDYLNKVDGRPRLEGAAAILRGVSKEEIVKAGDKKQAYFSQYLESEPIAVFSSTVKLLDDLAGRGVKLAVASSSKNARRILQKVNLLDKFAVDVSGTDFKKGKPDPEIFLLAASRLALGPQACVVFEDAQSGVEAARAGNFFCVGIDRHQNAAALRAANVVVKDLSEISVEDLIKMTGGN